MDFTLRQATLADVEGIFAVIGEHRDELVPRSRGNIVENIDRFLVADTVQGELAGCIAYQIWPEIGAPRNATVELQSGAVRTEFRRRGVHPGRRGKLLLGGGAYPFQAPELPEERLPPRRPDARDPVQKGPHLVL